MDKDTSKTSSTFNRTLEEIRLLNNKNEKLLKDFGIDITNLSDAAQEALDDYARIKQLTGLAELEVSFVEDYCYQLKAKRLEAQLQSIPLKTRIRQLRNDIKREEIDLAKLEQFVTETRALLIPTDEMEKMKITREKRIEMLRNKQKTLMEKADSVNLDELINKVNALDAEENV
ncbi:uncharacterized protein LOC131436426 [Malaya genurostris]|uniref:uncharacterized protein LOC131436426 n=1 Tax=Malaya genurostris TaxID=325434 RepID=UPI0026F3A659|nr:uncharacterized protein LOC131436426 [Malaya genurostris]